MSTLVQLTGFRLRWRNFVCRMRGHDFNVRKAKRFCRRCGREEWLFSKPYPAIGEPKYSWRYMDSGVRIVLAHPTQENNHAE